jgi:hypothetical protein
LSTVRIDLPVPVERAFLLLEDPRSLRTLVPGARRIRRFDPAWPAPGTLVHHTVGVFPLLVRDTTEVLACERDHRLLLEARLQMLGTFLIDMRLEPDGSASRLVIEETVIRGPFGHGLLRPGIEVLIMLRNLELGRRFRRLLEQRESARGSGPVA